MADSGKGECEKEGGGECEGEVEGECEKEGSGQRAEQGDAECEKEGGDDECEQVGDGDAEFEQPGDGDAECEQQGDGDAEREQEVDAEDTVPVEQEICQGDGVVEGHIETQCEGDTATVCSCSSSGEDGNGDSNVHVNDDYMEGLVDCEIQEDVGDGNCFGDIETDLEYGGESATEFSDSDVDDGIKSDDNRGLSDEEWESEELVSGAESDVEDDEESYGKFVTFTMPKSMVDYK
ncbi:hypothetical protein V8G54_037274 [Vigna mungo]|uniref:Uncharacterized protein n=1 Tax=Vigna mungo TaxID=3915 RepID=A0AAQ3MIX8_VIGMU